MGLLKNPKNAIYVILSEALHHLVWGVAKNLRISISYRDEILRPAFGETQNGTFSTHPSCLRAPVWVLRELRVEGSRSWGNMRIQ
jgi:hypothetical protein